MDGWSAVGTEEQQEKKKQMQLPHNTTAWMHERMDELRACELLRPTLRLLFPAPANDIIQRNTATATAQSSARLSW